MNRYLKMPQFARLKPATVLIVENEVLIRLELMDRLLEAGLAVFTAADADEAISALDTHSEIEILLTDIKMPGSMDGLRLAHHVRHRWPPVRIIVVSGLAETLLNDLPLDSIFLSKPHAPQVLHDALARMIAGGPRAAGPAAKRIA